MLASMRSWLVLVACPFLLVSSDCEQERYGWNLWMSSERASLYSYLASPREYYEEFYNIAANLSICMNAYFNKSLDAAADDKKTIWRDQLEALIPDGKNEHLYTHGTPLELHYSIKDYHCGITPLLTTEGLDIDLTGHKKLNPALVAERFQDPSEGLCCKEDLAFSFLMPYPELKDGTKTYKVIRKTMYCRKNTAVIGFSTGSQWDRPFLNDGYPRDEENIVLAENMVKTNMLDYESLSENIVKFEELAEMTKEDMTYKGRRIEAGHVTNLTKILFMEKLGDKVVSCETRKPHGFREYYGFVAIEPLERGKFGKSAEPVPIPDKSMLHKEEEHVIKFARVTSPKAFLITLKFTCRQTSRPLDREHLKKCARPDFYPWKEVTHVSGTGLRMLTTSWKTGNGNAIRFYKDMGVDYELVILFSLLLFLFLCFLVILKFRSKFLPKVAP